MGDTIASARRLTAACAAMLAGMAVSEGASAQTPAYIRANPDSVTKAFGADTAKKIFSDAFTPLRQRAVVRSQQTTPGYDCPANPHISLPSITAFPIRPGAVSWIERYVLFCTPRAQRNFLFILEGEQPRVIELLPGASAADPLLQHDALLGASAHVAPLRPAGCEKSMVIDTRITEPPKDRAPWVERWSDDLCGTKAEIEMTFTPSDRGGTDWTASLVK